MGIIATKKAAKQLQKVYEFLGNGGEIYTDNPGIWWTLMFEIQGGSDNKKEAVIGVYDAEENDIVFDPAFKLLLTMDGDKITEVQLMGYISQTPVGTFKIDENDVMYCNGVAGEKGGIKDRFSSFMNNMTKVGPYLRNAKNVIYYM